MDRHYGPNAKQPQPDLSEEESQAKVKRKLAMLHGDHTTRSDLLFERLRCHGIVIKGAKNVFGVPKLDILGHRLDVSCICLLPSKLLAIKDFPRATSNLKLRQFPGLVICYRSFVVNFAELLEHLEMLLTRQERQTSSLRWNEDAERAFGEVKNSLAEAVMLVHPKHDASTSLMTDASRTAVGAVLQQ